MPIIPFIEREQRARLKEYNSSISKETQTPFSFPLLLRNYETGWPLLQISYFVPSNQFYLPPSYSTLIRPSWWKVPVSVEKKEDTPVHYIKIESNQYVNNSECISIPLFSLACLLKKTFEPMSISDESEIEKILENNIVIKSLSQEIDPDRFFIDNIRYFLQKGFKISFKNQNIHLGSDFKSSLAINTTCLTFYEKVKFPILEGNNISNIIANAMSKAFSLAIKISNLDNQKSFLMKDLEVNEQIAILHKNQVYVDMGILFNTLCDDDNEKKIIIRYFEEVFKVKEFNKLKEAQSTFKPNEQFRPGEEKGFKRKEYIGKPLPYSADLENELSPLPDSPETASPSYRSSSGSEENESLSNSLDFPEHSFSSEPPPSSLGTSLPPLNGLDAGENNSDRPITSERDRVIRQAGASRQPFSNFSINSNTSSIKDNPLYIKHIRFIYPELFGGSRPDQLQEFGIIYRTLNDAYEKKKNGSKISLKTSLRLLAPQLISTTKIFGKEIFSSPRYFNNRDTLFRADEDQLVAWLEDYNTWKQDVVARNFQGYTHSEKKRFENVFAALTNPDYIDGVKLPDWLKPFKV